MLLSVACAMTLGLSACTDERNPTEPPSAPSLARGELSSCDTGSEPPSYTCVRYRNGDSVDISSGYDDFTVVATNSAGEFAGTYGQGGTFHAFLWSKGVLYTLPELDPGTAHATDINARGQVVGYSDSQSGTHAVLWEKGQVIDLGTLGGCCSWARSIDNSGQVFGSTVNAEGEGRAFVWKNGVMTDLGPSQF
jgi:chitinase